MKREKKNFVIIDEVAARGARGGSSTNMVETQANANTRQPDI